MTCDVAVFVDVARHWYQVGLKDYHKAEEMYRRALDRCKRSLGNEHVDIYIICVQVTW